MLYRPRDIVFALGLTAPVSGCADDLEEILDTEDSLGGVVGPAPDLGAPCNQSNPDRSGDWNVISNPASECERNVCVYFHAFEHSPETCERQSDCWIDGREGVLNCSKGADPEKLGACTLDQDFVEAHSYCGGACRDANDCQNPISGHRCPTDFTCEIVSETGSKACVCDKPPPLTDEYRGEERTD